MPFLPSFYRCKHSLSLPLEPVSLAKDREQILDVVLRRPQQRGLRVKSEKFLDTSLFRYLLSALTASRLLFSAPIDSLELSLLTSTPSSRSRSSRSLPPALHFNFSTMATKHSSDIIELASVRSTAVDSQAPSLVEATTAVLRPATSRDEGEGVSVRDEGTSGTVRDNISAALTALPALQISRLRIAKV